MNKIDRYLNRRLLKRAEYSKQFYTKDEQRILDILLQGWAYTSEEISQKTGIPIFFVEKAMAKFSLRFPIYMTNSEGWFIARHSAALYAVVGVLAVLAPVIVFYNV